MLDTTKSDRETITRAKNKKKSGKIQKFFEIKEKNFFRLNGV